ncbi:MAG: LPS export ABC transporter periplasmic protein LptC [Candidatus Kapabacteria bacterium]|nr:LPS export ABC transporter periplasmic protein LptC [Candidatus Kapabacteria bacterium]
MRILQPLLVCLVLAAFGCSDRTASTRVKDDPFLEAPAHLSYNIEVLFTDSSYTKAILTAGEARLYEDRQQTTLSNGVSVDFLSRTGIGPAARLTSDSALVDDRTRDMTAIGNVRVHSDSSATTLTTKRLIWVNSTQKIRSDAYVRIVSPTETIEGIGFESDQYLTAYRIFQVRGVHRP